MKTAFWATECTHRFLHISPGKYPCSWKPTSEDHHIQRWKHLASKRRGPRPCGCLGGLAEGLGTYVTSKVLVLSCGAWGGGHIVPGFGLPVGAHRTPAPWPWKASGNVWSVSCWQRLGRNAEEIRRTAPKWLGSGAQASDNCRRPEIPQANTCTRTYTRVKPR